MVKGQYFINRYKKLLPEFEPEVSNEQSLRINTLKTTHDEIIERLSKKGVKLKKIPWLKDGYWYEAPFSMGSTNEYLQGYYYLQGSPSQLVVEELNPEPGEQILDMAAAPGGKTTHAAQLMNNKGIIIAVDINDERLRSVINNAERLGIKNIAYARMNAKYVKELGMTYDKIILDAPCSGNYCSENNWFEKRSIEGIKENSRTQKELLRTAVQVLKPGGVMIYSTCSLEPEENEEVIDWLLRNIDDIELEPLRTKEGREGVTTIGEKKLDNRVSLTRRFWPQETKTEGFYMAKIRKSRKG